MKTIARRSRPAQLPFPTFRTAFRHLSPGLVAATASASLLMAASAGFGAWYAWTTGIRYGLILGVLAVVMALGLELAKPFALHRGFSLLGRLKIMHGCTLVFLATIAVAYSLTAELSLMAMARGDYVAERAGQSEHAHALLAQRTRLEAERKALPAANPSAAIKAQIDALMSSKRGLKGCRPGTDWYRTSAHRRTCVQVNELRAEMAMAQRREQIDTRIASLDAALGASNSAQRAADPAAQALSVYLAALGFSVRAAVITEWLVLVPVLALEIGSLLSVALVSAWAPARPKACQLIEAPQPPEGGTPEAVAPDVKGRLLSHVRDNGGKLFSGHRALAKALGVSHGTVGTVLKELADSGLIAINPSPQGTAIALA